MVSGLGLGKLSGVERKPTPKQERNNSPANPLFDKKLSQYSDEQDDQTETLDSNSAGKAPKHDGAKKVSKDELPSSNTNVSELSQMQMLNVPNQYNQIQATPKIDDAPVEASMQTSITDIRQLPAQVQPVAKFLKSMYENFGIEPAKVIHALNQLPANVLLQSPHEAMTPLFEKLEIQPKQFTKAEIIFNEMVSDIEKTPQDPALTGMMATKMPTLGKNEQKLQAKHKTQISSQTPTLDALIAQRWNRKAVEPQNYKTQEDMKTQVLEGGAALKAPSLLAGENQAAPSLSEIFHIDPNQAAMMQAQKLESPVAIDKLKDMDSNIQIQDIKLNPNKLTDQFFVDGNQDTATKLQQLQLKNLSQKGQNQDKENLKEELKSKLGDQNQIVQTQDPKIENQFTNNLNNKMDPALTPNLTDAKTNNISQLTESTKSLIAKGGGEMKIQLHPDGLGQVNLKVKVQDGQVGIQMTADNHDAKRLLETGLNDLKMNLAEHKLNLSHAKIEVADQLNNNMMNMEHNMHREEARDFLGQFREWNQSLRDMDMGHGSLGAYKKAAPAPDIQSAQARKSGRDGGLYLVA